MSPDDVCQLCGRCGVKLTRHHLIPKSRSLKKKGKKGFDLDAALNGQALLCPPCHTQAHKILSERAMETQYASVESLAAHPEMGKFVRWISTKPPGLQPRMRRWRGHERAS